MGEDATVCHKLVVGILSMYSKLAGRFNTSYLTCPEAILIQLSKFLSQDARNEREKKKLSSQSFFWF